MASRPTGRSSRDEALRATRAAYDRVAADYARLLPDLSVEAPLDRAVLRAFAEMVELAGGGPAVEVGCGSGRVTAHLADAGLRVVGLDLSPGMVREARAARPDLGLAVAHAAALPVRSGALGGLLAWYSLIHLPSEELAGVAAEFARVTRPGAPVLLAFQCGDGERVQRSSSYGHDVALTYSRHRVSDVVDALEQAGLAVQATVERRPSQGHESTPQACVLAQRATQSRAGSTQRSLPDGSS
jgi:ubiquinone/menaquinone biosynthesis C-methylase UbiE